MRIAPTVAFLTLALSAVLAGCATMAGRDPTADLEGAEVTSRMIEGDLIEEYRVQGRLHVVKVTPRRGAPYYLIDTNGDGRLDSSEGEGTVSPVMWKLFEWN